MNLNSSRQKNTCIDNLCDDTLRELFRLVCETPFEIYSLRQVCKRWRDVGFQIAMEMVPFRYAGTFKDVVTLTQYSSHIQAIKYSRVPKDFMFHVERPISLEFMNCEAPVIASEIPPSVKRLRILDTPIEGEVSYETLPHIERLEINGKRYKKRRRLIRAH